MKKIQQSFAETQTHTHPHVSHTLRHMVHDINKSKISAMCRCDSRLFTVCHVDMLLYYLLSIIIIMEFKRIIVEANNVNA